MREPMLLQGQPQLERVQQLLEKAGLPTADLTPNHLAHFLLGTLGGESIGVVGVEACGKIGLLRSLAVIESYRGRGLGAHLESTVRAVIYTPRFGGPTSGGANPRGRTASRADPYEA